MVVCDQSQARPRGLLSGEHHRINILTQPPSGFEEELRHGTNVRYSLSNGSLPFLRFKSFRRCGDTVRRHGAYHRWRKFGFVEAFMALLHNMASAALTADFPTATERLVDAD